MGSYIIRSINAHFRSLDDGIKDSFSEELVQAPRQGFDIATCDCSGLHPTPTCGGPLCQPNERLFTQECEPPGCEINLKTKDMVMEECRPDETCCTAWATATVCPGGPEGGKCCGVNAASVAGFGQPCADGHVLESRKCFTNPETIEYRCSAESVPACVFTCSADKGTTANWCCDTTADTTCYQKNLTHNNTTTTFVTFGTLANPKQNCTTAPCQAYCNTGLTASTGGCFLPVKACEPCFNGVGPWPPSKVFVTARCIPGHNCTIAPWESNTKTMGYAIGVFTLNGCGLLPTQLNIGGFQEISGCSNVPHSLGLLGDVEITIKTNIEGKQIVVVKTFTNIKANTSGGFGPAIDITTEFKDLK